MKQQPTLWQRFRSMPILYNLFLAGCVLLGLCIAAHFAMQIGTRHGARRTVPNFTGLSLDEAKIEAVNNNLRLYISDSLYVPAYAGGVVLEQLPEGGVEVKPDRTVYLTINSHSQRSAIIPYVANRSLRQAKNMLEVAGFQIKELRYRPDLATNYVLEQSYNGKPIMATTKTKAQLGSGVTLFVGVASGENITAIPSVEGMKFAQAKSRLWESGLNVKYIFDKGINLVEQKNSTVYKQSPSAGSKQVLGSTVTIRLKAEQK